MQRRPRMSSSRSSLLRSFRLIKERSIPESGPRLALHQHPAASCRLIILQDQSETPRNNSPAVMPFHFAQLSLAWCLGPFTLPNSAWHDAWASSPPKTEEERWHEGRASCQTREANFCMDIDTQRKHTAGKHSDSFLASFQLLLTGF